MAGMENDLWKLNGIGPKITEMLEKLGVDSIKELSHRRADNLFKTIEEKHGTVVGVSEKTVQTWIDEAAAWKETSVATGPPPG